jgi:hypothetical protein
MGRRSSRHCAVLELPKAAPLYNQPAETAGLHELLSSSLEARPILFIQSITASNGTIISDQFAEIDLLFWSTSDYNENKASFGTTVYLPKVWTPKMYLASLHLSLKRHNLLSIESVFIGGTRYNSMNDMDLLFGDLNDTIIAKNMLIVNAAYQFVCGGTLLI